VTCDGEVKTAVVIYKLNISVESARRLLDENDGSLRKVIDPR
jgi:N-acetylmuramic acid 6-phosphate (MurNAc-6-P) etherase